MGGRRRMRKKVSVLTKEKIEYVDYKDVNLLRRFISDRAKIRARRITGNNEQQQRAVALAIKNAREMALLPYENRVTSQRRILESGQFGIFTHEDAMDEQGEGEYFTPSDPDGGAPSGISAGSTPPVAVDPSPDADPVSAAEIDADPAGADAADATPAADAPADVSAVPADADAADDAPAGDAPDPAAANPATDDVSAAPADADAADADPATDDPQGA